MYNRLSSLSVQQNESLSNIINQLVQTGMQKSYEEPYNHQLIEQHCQQLIIQMNALIKNISVKLLQFNQEDFEQLRLATLGKYNELVGMK